MVKQNLENKQVNYSYLPPTEEPFLDTFEQNHRSYQLFKERGLDKDVAGPHETGPKIGQPMSTVEKILDEGIFRRLRRSEEHTSELQSPQ